MRRSIARLIALALLAACGHPVLAQVPAPPAAGLAALAAKRFPQPVRVGDLLDRPVLRPTESRAVLGRVIRVIRQPGGSIHIVMTYGGYLGIGSRIIAVPVDGMALLGAELEIIDFTPEQLRDFPRDDGTAAETLSADESIRMGLARPSH